MTIRDVVVEGLTAPVTDGEREAASRPPYPVPPSRAAARERVLRELESRLPADGDGPLVDPQGAGDLWVAIDITAPEDRDWRIDQCRSPGPRSQKKAVTQCTVQTGPDDATVLVQTTKQDSSDYTENSVTVYRAGTTIWIASTNSDRETRTSGGAPAPTRPTPSLTVEHLLDLALSRELVLHP